LDGGLTAQRPFLRAEGIAAPISHGIENVRSEPEMRA
jgi:hypothetical protein